MNIEESIQQIETLIEAWQLDEADLNQTDINAMQTLLKENQELKKQVEDISEELELVRCALHNRTSERDGYERELNECLSQQKEFIKYLEDESKEVYRDDGLRQNIFRQILQKYKEITGVSDEKK